MDPGRGTEWVARQVPALPACRRPARAAAQVTQLLPDRTYPRSPCAAGGGPGTRTTSSCTTAAGLLATYGGGLSERALATNFFSFSNFTIAVFGVRTRAVTAATHKRYFKNFTFNHGSRIRFWTVADSWFSVTVSPVTSFPFLSCILMIAEWLPDCWLLGGWPWQGLRSPFPPIHLDHLVVSIGGWGVVQPAVPWVAARSTALSPWFPPPQPLSVNRALHKPRLPIPAALAGPQVMAPLTNQAMVDVSNFQAALGSRTPHEFA